MPASVDQTNRPGSQAALLEADRCVKCGLCLPTCPTYGLYADENESPRGRIALAEALLQGQIQPSRQIAQHLNNCLLCLRCQAVCPSGVRYDQLIDQARASTQARSLAGRAARHAGLAPLAGQLARYLPGTLGRLARSLPPAAAPAPAPGLYPPSAPARGRVGLLLGCVTRFNQGGALHAAISLLNRLGYLVSVAPGQTCCGALAQHHGDLEQAAQMAAQNRRAFGRLDALLSVASGCSLQLREHAEGVRGMDILEFLDQAAGWESLAFVAPAQSWVLHQPCSLSNGLGAADAATRLLARLPGGVAPTLLGAAGDCCGASGEHLLTHRAQARRLREPLLKQLLQQQPQVLLSSNVGCAMHLAEGAAAGLPELQVLHPVEWMVRHLQADRD